MAGSLYVGLGNLDAEMTVDDLLDRWMEAEKVPFTKSHVSLWHVRGGGRPQPEHEADAVQLDDPSAKLVDIGVQYGAWLLAKVITEQPLADAAAGAAAAGPGAATAGAAAGLPGSAAPALPLADLDTFLRPRATTLPSAGSLRNFIENVDGIILPVESDLYEEWSVRHDTSSLLRHLRQVKNGELPKRISCALRARIDFKTKQDVCIWVQELVCKVLEVMNESAPLELKAGFTFWRDKADLESGLTLLGERGGAQRPDVSVVVEGSSQLEAKMEFKKDRLQAAEDDLERKTAVASRLLYGDMQYLFCVAAAGKELKFCFVPFGQPLQPASGVIDVSSPAGRLAVLRMLVNVYTLLRLIRATIPKYVLPLGEPEVLPLALPDRSWRRAITYSSDLTLVKAIQPWSSYCSYYKGSVQESVLADIYAKTRDARGLVHAVGDPHFDAIKDVYRVQLSPAGRRAQDALPQTEEQLQAAVHAMLHGLDSLHKNNFVHRDLRWDNVACTFDFKYFLIDLELAGQAGVWQPTRPLRGWGPHTLVDVGGGSVAYHPASDMYEVGRLILGGERGDGTLSHKISVSMAGKQLAESLMAAGASERPTAAQALRHAWIGCVGAGCAGVGP